MTALTLPAILQLIAACAPTVAPTTMASVLRTESGFDPWTLHVNGPGGGDLHPASKDDAIAQAVDLIVVQRRSVDLGLGQVNSANLASLGLTVTDALDPCKNLGASAKLLTAGYTTAAQGQADPQRALRAALSQYNTGDPVRGIANGYVGKVERSAQYVVPAIASALAPPELAPAGAGAPVQPVQAESLPPSWDAFGLAAMHPASVFGSPDRQSSPNGQQVLAAELQASPGANASPVLAPLARPLAFRLTPPGQEVVASSPPTGASAPVLLHAAE